MYRRMIDEGYLEPWPDGEEPGAPQDLLEREEVDAHDGEATAA
jgi:hypothetical protein